MSWIIDRIEGDLAVVQAGDAEFTVPVAALPADAGEGSVLRVELDEAATASALQRAADRLAALVDDDGGDFSL